LLKKLLREPLLHFLVIGAALFLIYNFLNDNNTIDNNRIVISQTTIDRFNTVWLKKRHRPPTQTELDSLIEQQIREEVMYREALALGLDKDDGIVRRRLAQKVEFIFSDIASQTKPSESELTNYLTKHSDKFSIAGHISFDHVYFNPDKHGEALQKEIQQLLNALSQPKSQVDFKTAGDAFMLGQHHEQLTEHGVSRIFGQDFATKIFTLATENWLGPIQSGYGLHLIRINKKTDTQQATLESVRDKVITEWQAQQRRNLDESFYQSLRQRYDIIIENKATKTKSLTKNSALPQR
jgi:hypothetical protein